MMSYTGNGAYCYANCLHMSLDLVDAQPIYTPAFLECLTTMPFGKLYLQVDDNRLFFPGAEYIDPDGGLSRAIATMGWKCDILSSESEAVAREQLRLALEDGPVLIGPVNMGALTYMHGYTHMHGADHFIIALAYEDHKMRVHDPNGFANVTLSVEDFMRAWRADGVFYRREGYIMRTNFRKINSPTRQDILTTTLGHIRTGLQSTDSEHVLRLLSADLRTGMSDSEHGHLLHFAFPLAARRLNDAAVFLNECGQDQAATVILEQSRLFGDILYPAVHDDWQHVAELTEQIAELEAQFVQCILKAA